jgi:hypothetical protein
MSVTDVELKRGTETRPRVQPSMAEPGSRSKLPTRDSSGGGVPATRNNITSRDESRGEPFVAVMQAIDLRDGEDSPFARWHDWAWVWAILVE